MKRIHLLRWGGEEPPAALGSLFAAARAAGLRVGWLDLAAAPPPPAPPSLEPAASAGAFRAVAVGGGRAVSVKATGGPPVLGDLLREHFLGCALVVVSEPPGGAGEARLAAELGDAPRLERAGDRWRVTPAGSAARELPVEELVARLRRPRPWE